MMIKKVTLEGPRIRLEPLEAHHAPGLAEAIRDGNLWEVPTTFVPHPDDLSEHYKKVLMAYAAGTELPFVTIVKAQNLIVGCTHFRCYDARHYRTEIGSTFISKSWQRSFVNTEAKYLMLQYAFEIWGLNRVEFLTDALNIQSRNAIRRLGAKEEGILRRHMIMRDGRVRDTVIHSILREDWPEVSSDLRAKLLSPETSD